MLSIPDIDLIYKIEIYAWPITFIVSTNTRKNGYKEKRKIKNWRKLWNNVRISESFE